MKNDKVDSTIVDEDSIDVILERKNRNVKEVQPKRTNLVGTRTNREDLEKLLTIEKTNYDHDHHKNIISVYRIGVFISKDGHISKVEPDDRNLIYERA